MTIAFTGRLILPGKVLESGILVCKDGTICEAGVAGEVRIPEMAEVVSAEGGYISPGFVDIHVHGGGGADYMDGEPGATITVNQTHARHGTTTIFPTTTVGSDAQISSALAACAKVRADWKVALGARMGGVHFYGPYFAPDKVGAHPGEWRREPVREEYCEYFDEGIIRVATCAAELPGADGFYREAARRGYLVTCGHSNASWSEMESAFQAGMRHVDHFWCAMSSITSVRQRFGMPSQGSMEQFVLMNEAMSTEVIADGDHLAPELLQFACRMLGPERLCLVSDANRALDAPAGEYTIGPKEAGRKFISDGRISTLPGGGLASSMSGMDRMVRTMLRSTQVGIADVIRMASLTPAQRVGSGKSIGSLEAGKKADVLVLSSALEVERVWIEGEEFI